MLIVLVVVVLKCGVWSDNTVEPRLLELPREMTNKTTCGSWHGTILIALKWTRGCIMMQDGNVAEDF